MSARKHVVFVCSGSPIQFSKHFWRAHWDVSSLSLTDFMASVTEFHWKEDRPQSCCSSERTDDEEIMVLKVDPDIFAAIASGSKRWEARPLVEHRKGGGNGDVIAPWKYLHLATEGRIVKLQRYYESGLLPPHLFLRVAEVRRYEVNERSSIPPEQAMLMDLGGELLPDVADASTIGQQYRDYYGDDTCAHGFVAMRLLWEDFRVTVPHPYRRHKVKVTVKKISGEIWVEIDVWPILTTLAHIVFVEARVDRFDLQVPYLIYNARVQPYWKSIMQFPVVRDGGEALELAVVFQPKEIPIKSLFDQVRPFTYCPGSVLEFEMPYDTFKDCLTKPCSCDPRYMDMELLMNTLYPEQKVLQIWTMLTRELTRSSNTNCVEAYPVETCDRDP